MIIKTDGNSKFEPVSAGTHIAVCYGVVGVGKQFSQQFEKSSPKVAILWEIIDEEYESGGPKTISKIYTASLNEKSTLRKDLAAWRSKDLTPEEAEGFELYNIVGVPCLLSIVEDERNGKHYSNIASISRLPKTMSAPSGTFNQIIKFDISENPRQTPEFDALPEWLKTMCKKCDEWIEVHDFAGSDVPEDDPF